MASGLVCSAVVIWKAGEGAPRPRTCRLWWDCALRSSRSSSWWSPRAAAALEHSTVHHTVFKYLTLHTSNTVLYEYSTEESSTPVSYIICEQSSAVERVPQLVTTGGEAIQFEWMNRTHRTNECMRTGTGWDGIRIGNWEWGGENVPAGRSSDETPSAHTNTPLVQCSTVHLQLLYLYLTLQLHCSYSCVQDV